MVKDQPFILDKLLRTDGLDGVVFFSIDQFCYGEKFNLKLLRDILKERLSVHFAREDISLSSVVELDERFTVLSAYFHAFKRRRTIRPEEILRIVGRSQ